ncbi:Nucleosome-remodeling factor subunit BPTF isoform 1 [Schistosoma japonicum]|uniref:Nucleosome-remodeling factor subunit BPTF isoform 1 n=1 Tax=Schistosoma japonicum TaxID=6182 RepID=A0A4Z2CV02_SCHJA|nr:Nucleosome-remodeling factor subunit BPTF isoform 1 [Schistosoma japonicum]
MDSSSTGTNGLVGCATANVLAGAKKRTKVVFLSPVEVANWDQIKENSRQNVIDENDLINYEKMLKDDDCASMTGSNSESRRRQSKRRGRPKGSRNGARKRPVDPSQPWLESSDSDEPNVGLEDELDDDEYFRRLEEEKMREDAEEVSRKRREMEARAAARASAQGRKGCAKNDPFITHQFQTPVNSDSNLSCQSGSQREFGHQIKKQKCYAALSGFREVSDSDDFSELDDKCANRDGDYPKSLDDIYEQNEEDYQELTSPLRQSVFDMLPPSPVVPLNSEEYKSSLKCESLNVTSSNDLNAVRTMVSSASFNDLHTQKMLEMDPVELRFRAPPLILPASANDLVCPRKYVLDVLSIYEVLRRYGSLLRLSPFRLEDFAASLISDENSSLLAEAHMVLLKALLREDEANGTAMCPVDCRDSVNMTFYLLDRFTWPYLLASYLLSIKSSEAAARLSVANTTTAASSVGGPTGSGGADVVLTAALFPSDLIPLNPDYPFVPIESRIAVLRGLVNLFLATGSVRGDILREGLMTHEDYCRVCHQSGEVLCCDGCTAVFHLHCLNPPLSSVPTTSWICPVCIKKRTPGVTDCLSEAEKNGVAHYQEPIGKDRAGRLYWYISRRLIIEPVDFSQREPALMGFHDGVVDNLWEMEYGRELMENDPEVKEEDGDENANNVHDNDSPNYSTDNNTLIDATSKLSSSDSNQSASEINSNKQETRRKYQCNPSISYANEPCVYYYSSIEQVMHIRELLSTEWEPWLCYRLDALLPRMHTEMAITQKLTENGLQQFCLLKPNHKAISLSCSDSNQNSNVNVNSNTVHVYSVLEVEQALFKKLSKVHGETSDCPKKKLAIAASSLPSMDAPIFPTLPKELPSFLDKRSDDFCTELIVTDQNSCIIRSYDQVISQTIKETSDDVATYPPTILEPQELSTLHMIINSANSPTTADEYLLAYRLSDEGNWRSWTNLYTAGVWTGEESSTNNLLKDSLNGELKRTPSGTRNSNPVNNDNNSGIDPDDIMTSDSVNVAMTRAQHMDEKERRRLLSNKFNLSEFTCDLWQYIDPATLASTYKTIIDMMGNPINELLKIPAFERIRFDCWPASPYQLLDLLRLTLCYMESKIPVAFFTPAWRSHRQNWIKDVLDSKSPSDLAFVLARLEASIRSVCFQRVWFNSLGHLTLERMTTSQREEDKRLRQFDRFSSTTSAGSVNPANLPTNLIRTKTPRPIRHTVWKTRGEEYRRLGGDGWMWLSATRGNAGQVAERALRIRPSISSVYQSETAATSLVNRSLLSHRRGLQHGIGWGVCPEYLQDQIALKPPKASECRGHVLHPITGIPLYLNPKRNPYIIPSDELHNLNEQIKKSSLSQHIVDDAKKDNPETYLINTGSNNGKVTSEDTDTSEKNEGQLDSLNANSDTSEITKVEERKGLLSGQTMSIKNTDHNNDDNMNPVLNVSYCISNRIHFPPCVEMMSVDKSNHSSSSSSKRLHFRLDSLLQHRHIAAENDKKAGLAALSAVSKLEKEIESLEKRHTEVIQRLTTLSTDAQQARTAKAQAVKAKQNALLVKPSLLPFSGNIVTNSKFMQSSENPVNTPTIGKQLIQQSVLTDQGVRYRVLAPRTTPNMHMNQVAFNPIHKAASTPSRTPTANRSTQRHRASRTSDLSESDSDSDPVPPGIRQGDSWSGRENVPLRRSARRIRAVRHDPDFIVDFDEDDDEDDRLSTKADDSDNFDPNDEVQGSSKKIAGQRRSQTAVHLNSKSTTNVRGLPQYDGAGDTTDEDVDEYDDDIVEEDEEVVDDDVVCDYDYIDDDYYDDEAGEYYYDNDEIEDDEVVDDEEEGEVEDYLQVYSAKQTPTRVKLKIPEKSLKVSTLPYPTHSGKTDAVPVMPKVVILKNNNATPNIQGNNTHSNSSNPRILPNPSAPGQRIILPATMKLPPTSNDKSIPSVMMPSGNIKESSQSINPPGQPFNMPQNLRLVRIVRNPDGGTNIVPVAASDTILPTVEPNINQTLDNSNTSNTRQSNPLSSSVTKLNSLDGGIHLVLNSNTGLNSSLTLSKPSVVSVESSESKPVITNTHFVSTCVENETSNVTPPQPITITAADIPHSGIRLTDLNTSFTVASVPGLNHPTTVNIATVGKLKPPSANSVRFVIAPSSTGSFGSTNLNQIPTITVVKASNPSDVSSDPSTVTSSVTSSLPPLLPRKPPAILRRTLAGPPSTSLLSPVSSSGDSAQVISQPSVRTPSVASLVATNTARQLVCGDLNRYIPTTLSFRPIISDSPRILDLHQGRRSMAKAQHHIRNASLLDEDSSRFMINNDSKVLVSDYQGTFRQFGPTVRLQQTPVIDEATLNLDRAVTEANAKLDSINANIATVRSEAQELESQINSLKSELNKYQEIVNRGSPEISSPYSLSLRNNADFDLSNKSFVNRFLRNNHSFNKKKAIVTGKDDGVTTADSHHMAILPQSLPYINSYSWPIPNSMMTKDHSTTEEKQNTVLIKSTLFRLNPRNLRHIILSAGRREVPGYDVEKKRLSQVNWLYPSSRPNFAECWRFRLSQIRIGRYKNKDNISFGLDLANFALLLRTLWHCIRWDDILAEPDEDSRVLDSAGRPCFRKAIDIDDDEEEDVGGCSSGRQDDISYAVRRIVEIQPLDRFWLQANYKVRITTTHPVRSYPNRRRKATSASDLLNKNRSGKGPSFQDSSDVDESTSRRKGRRGGQKNPHGGKDPDYDPAIDEGWRVGIHCTNNSSRRQSRNNSRSGRGSLYDSEDDDGFDTELGARRRIHSQRNEVSVEEKWMSEDAVFLWEIRVFMNSLLPPKSNYPPTDNTSLNSNSDNSNRYLISTRLASLPPDPNLNNDSAPTTVTQDNSLISSSNVEVCLEKDGFVYGSQSKRFLTNNSSRRSSLASALQSSRVSVNSRSRSDDHSVSSIPRPLSPNTLEAKARARSIAATNAARASVAARRARFERALLEQRVRSLKSQFCARKRLIFNWAKSLADVAVNEIKGAQQTTKTDKSKNKNLLDGLENSPLHYHHTTEKSTVRKGRPNVVSHVKSSSTLEHKNKIGRPKSTNVYRKRIKQKNTPTFSLSSGDENKNINFNAEEQNNEIDWTPGSNFNDTNHSELLAHNRTPRRSALNHGFIKTSRNTATPTTVTKTSKTLQTTTTPKSPDIRMSKNRLTMKLSLKRSNKSLVKHSGSTTSSCSTPSTSPGLGDYDRCREKQTGSSKTNRLLTSKSKKSKHESSNSDASSDVTPSLKSPRGSGSSRGHTAATIVGTERKGGRPKSSDRPDKNEIRIDAAENVMQGLNLSASSGVYCVCKTPYDALREYIGCDLCRDWFHFECVGLDPRDADKLGDSWHCPDCKQAELKANEMLYCVCRTPYEPTRVYIACDGCDEWYHPECVGLTSEQAVNHTDTYLCPACCQLSKHTAVTTAKSSSVKSKKSKSFNSNKTTVDQPVAAKTIYETDLTSDRVEKLIHLIEEIKQHKMSWPFFHTPDPVKFPAAKSLDNAFNLPSVLINLKGKVYKTLGDFSFDMNRLFTKSRLIYPKDTPEFNCTEIIEALFIQKMKQFKEENL